MRRVPAPLVLAFAAVAGLPAAIAPGSVLAHVSYLFCFSTLVGLGWVRLRAFSGPVRTGYTFIVGALTVWLSGDVLYDVLSWLIGPLGDVSPSDVLWVSGYPLLAIGLIRLVRLRAPGKLREGMLDALTMATVMAWLCWQFLILPAAEHQKLSLAIVCAAFYPLGDVVLFAAAAILVLAPGSKRGATRYLTAALTLTLVGDVCISMLPALFPDLSRTVQADRLDGLLLVANSFFVAALVHGKAGRIADPDTALEQRLHPARVIFLGIALVALPMFAGLQAFDSVLSRISLLGSIALLTSLILVRFVLVVREQERIRAELAHQAQHDQLTGLANRQALQAGLDRALVGSGGRDSGYGPVIFYLDLNGFKQINDRYGHAAGDYVLVEFAGRLRAGLRPGDVAARLGGDEFAVLAENVANEADAQAITERLRDLTIDPVCRFDDAYAVGVSIGMAAAGDFDRPDSEVMLVAADSAMYADKARHRQADQPAPVVTVPDGLRSVPARTG
jgi:diguanylate cyclase (GGDEF)-like protein